jgi:hypothetical protein
LAFAQEKDTIVQRIILGRIIEGQKLNLCKNGYNLGPMFRSQVSWFCIKAFFICRYSDRPNTRHIINRHICVRLLNGYTPSYFWSGFQMVC